MPWKWGRPRVPPAPGPATKEAPGEGRAPEGLWDLPGDLGGMDPPGLRFLRVPGEGGTGGGKVRGGSRP